MKLTGAQRRGLYNYWREQKNPETGVNYTSKEANARKNSIWKAYEHHAKIARLQEKYVPDHLKHKPPAVNLTYGQIKDLKKDLEKQGANLPGIGKSKLARTGGAITETKKQHEQKYIARVRGYVNKLERERKAFLEQEKKALRPEGLKGKKLNEALKQAGENFLKRYKDGLQNAQNENAIYSAIQESYKNGLKPTVETDADGDVIIRI